MTSTETGCGRAATGMSFTFTSKQLASARPSSPTMISRVADNSVDPSYNNPHNHPNYEEGAPSIIMSPGLSWPAGFDSDLMSPGDSNYQIVPTQSFSTDNSGLEGTYFSPNELGFSSHLCSTWPERFEDVTRPRTFPEFQSPIDFVQDGTPAPFVSMYQVQSQMHRPAVDLTMAPTSDSYIHIQDEEYEHSTQGPDILESIETCAPNQRQPILMHQPNQEELVRPHPGTPFDEDMDTVGDELDGDKAEPYAKSLFRCLKQSPKHTMILRDIYDWFRGNTDKGQDPHERGWQNSIRHNLSMNKAFEKIEVPSGDDPSKKGYQWRLSEQALRDGRVQSTTRFRNKQPNKRGSKSLNPAPHRVKSGRAGGEMARRYAEVRRSERLRDIRHGLHETGSLLRSQGIIRENDPAFIVPVTSSQYSGLEYLTANMGNSSHSAPTSPYFMLPDDSNFPRHQQNPAFNLMVPSPAFQAVSYPNSPDMSSQPIEHFPPIGDRLFYDSTESCSEPRTPESFTDAHLDMRVDAPFYFPTEELTFGAT